MPTLLDHLYVVLFAVVLPLIDYVFFWPGFRRRAQDDPARARMWLWAWTIGSAWPIVALGAWLWVANDRSWASFGFSAPVGWRLWTAVALTLLLVAYFVTAIASLVRSAEQRGSLRQQIGTLDTVLPHTQRELSWFAGVSITAGFCEEFLYRGYFIWVLAPWIGWWGAASISILTFAILHAYQGRSGVIRTGIAGAIFTLVVATFNSLWPAIALHALLDLGQGCITWLALKDEPAAVKGSSTLHAR